MKSAKMVICIGSSCFARGNAANAETAQRFVREHNLDKQVEIDICGGLCTEHCPDGPIVILNGRIYKHVDTALMQQLLQSLLD